MKESVENKEILVHGRLIRTARLRHEWCEYFSDPKTVIHEMQRRTSMADILTFIPEIYAPRLNFPFRQGTASAAVLTISTFEKWRSELNFKVRNKIKKAEKQGVELREQTLTDEFAKGVEGIYNESPVRQGKRFWHYGKNAAIIKTELADVIDNSNLVGAYYKGEMIGFMKLCHGLDILRTIHIIAKLAHRDKPVMDAFISHAVQMCERNNVKHLQYGSWSTRNLGEFKMKHGFVRVEIPRFFAPLSMKGRVLLKLNFPKSYRDCVPQSLIDKVMMWRSWMHAARTGSRRRSEKI